MEAFKVKTLLLAKYNIYKRKNNKFHEKKLINKH
jgi:hypothetical protein